MKLLLVDDSRTMRNIQKNVLKTMPEVTFMEAGDGAEGLMAMGMGTVHFDLLLVDWNMPNMNGLTFVRCVREKDKTTPIIMVTTEAEKTSIVEAIKAGVNNYVIKPFTPDTLLERVQATLAKHKVAAAVAA
jgi:two-component system, chemotaxis family, chemotaxis protein CheY